MEELLGLFINCKRFCRSGKNDFIREVSSFCKGNLDKFEFSIQKNFFVFDYKEFFKIFALFINAIFLILITANINVSSFITEGVLLLIIFVIQYRLLFLFLTFLIPSKNVILSRNGTDKDTEVIICAHYDTVNALTTRKKFFIEKFLKYNVYAISRAVGKLLFYCEKYTSSIIILLYLFLIFNMNNFTQYSLSLNNNISTIFNIVYTLGFSLLLNTFICSIIIILLTISFSKNHNNHGADDNTSGVVGALEIAKEINYLNLNYNVKIILFDNEEKGLIGSNHFVIKNITKFSKNPIVINLDCIGRGDDIHIMTDDIKQNKTYQLITEVMSENNLNVHYTNMDYSDHKSFLSKGINAISIGRYQCKKYLWKKDFPNIDWIHGSEDKFEDIDINKINQIVRVVVDAIKNIKKTQKPAHS